MEQVQAVLYWMYVSIYLKTTSYKDMGENEDCYGFGFEICSYRIILEIFSGIYGIVISLIQFYAKLL